MVTTAPRRPGRADDIGSGHVMRPPGGFRMTIEEDAVVTPVTEVGGRPGGVPDGGDHRPGRSRRDHGFDPAVTTQGSMAGGPTRARTAGVR